MPSSRRPLAPLATASAAAALLAAAVLGGCSSEDGEPSSAPSSSATDPGAPVVQLGGPGEENRTLSPEEAEGLEAPTHTDADVAFVHAMIPHHQQALELTAMVEGRTASEEVPLMAERIELSQDEEVAQLERWLTERGEPLELPGGGHGEHGAHGTTMPGMLTDAELAELRAAEGRRFDRMWLQAMVRHHEGAVQMVEELLSTGSAAVESETFQLVSHIESDQLVEIARMRQMLADGDY